MSTGFDREVFRELPGKDIDKKESSSRRTWAFPPTFSNLELGKLFGPRLADNKSMDMSSSSFERHSGANDGAAWEGFVSTTANLTAKLEILRDFLAGKDNPAITQAHVDKTAFSVTRLVAAFNENPFVIRDYTASTTNPREITAPHQTWGSIKAALGDGVRSGSFVLELHNQTGRIELPLTQQELNVALDEITMHRLKCA